MKKDEIKKGEKQPADNPKTQVFVLDETTNERIPFREYEARLNASRVHEKPRIKVFINPNGLGEIKAPKIDWLFLHFDEFYRYLIAKTKDDIQG